MMREIEIDDYMKQRKEFKKIHMSKIKPMGKEKVKELKRKRDPEKFIALIKFHKKKFDELFELTGEREFTVRK